MINIQYNHPNIKVTTDQVEMLYNLPLTVSFKNHVSKETHWGCEIGNYQWASFSNDSIFDVEVKDSLGHIVLYREWNVEYDGSNLDKSLYYYCKSIAEHTNSPAHGLAIGTHDGEFGEWVAPVLGNLTHATLVEASLPQFQKLTKNYNKISKTSLPIHLIHNLVTTDGEPAEFFEGGKGYTNSVKEKVIKSWEKEKINSNLRNSISINDLIGNRKFNWLHLDIEGYDAEIIKAINVDLLPNFIIFEHNNLSLLEKGDIESYLENLNYSLYKNNPVSYLAQKW